VVGLFQSATDVEFEVEMARPEPILLMNNNVDGQA